MWPIFSPAPRSTRRTPSATRWIWPMGTRSSISHFNRPHFDILGMKIEFDFNSRDWMLKTMKHMKFLRRLMPDLAQAGKGFQGLVWDLGRPFEYTSPEKYDRWVGVLPARRSPGIPYGSLSEDGKGHGTGREDTVRTGFAQAFQSRQPAQTAFKGLKQEFPI